MVIYPGYESEFESRPATIRRPTNGLKRLGLMLLALLLVAPLLNGGGVGDFVLNAAGLLLAAWFVARCRQEWQRGTRRRRRRTAHVPTFEAPVGRTARRGFSVSGPIVVRQTPSRRR